MCRFVEIVEFELSQKNTAVPPPRLDKNMSKLSKMSNAKRTCAAVDWNDPKRLIDPNLASSIREVATVRPGVLLLSGRNQPDGMEPQRHFDYRLRPVGTPWPVEDQQHPSCPIQPLWPAPKCRVC
jgi:hypothetical protein